MLLPKLHTYLAYLLLLCLGRTLLPEAWVLALHAHEHTTEEPTLVARKAKPDQAVLSPKHTHCHSEQFYDVPFAASLPIVLPQPRLQLRYLALAVPATLACPAAELRRPALRGPPAA